MGARVLGTLDVADTWVTVPLLGAFPWFVVWSASTAVVAVHLRVRAATTTRTAVTALLVGLVAITLVLPRVRTEPQPRAEGEVVTVAAVNVRIGAADTDRVAALALDLGVDLLAVVEATHSSSDALVDGPLGAVLTTAENATTDVGGLIIARGGLEPLDGLPHAGGTPDVRWRTPGGNDVAVTTLHASAPIGPTATQRWRTGIARTPVPADVPSLVLGDFNATLDHTTFRELLTVGWRDAADEAGAGLSFTYDGVLDVSPGLPMAIDHALVSPGIAVRSFTTHDVPGTDHRLIVAKLQLP